jgi:aminopeptidase N
MLKLGGKTLNNFNEWFGSIELSSPKIIITPREKGGGYARRGIIILSKINDEDFLNSKNRYIQYFAHELSHFWWTNAPTDSWEDWLNESFAEYSALLSLRDLVGESEFNGMIQKKSTNFNELPPVRGIDRDDEKAYDVLYNKGCYILYTLEKDIGTEKFMELIREVYLNKISCTEDLINLITKKFGTEVAQRFNSQLDV